MSWTEARAACQSMAPGTGELASVSDGVATAYFIEHLNYFLASLIPDTNPVFEAWGTGTLAFIGANRYSGGWAWNDGNPWQYMRWGPLQPSNDASEKILTMSSGGYFYDDPPTPPYVWGFICQYERTRFQIYLSISFVITSYILKYLLQGITCSQGKYFGFYSNMGPRIQVVCRDIHRFIWE